MKKLLTIMLFSYLILACNNNSKKEEDKSKTSTENSTATEGNDNIITSDENTVNAQLSEGRFGIKSAKVVTRTTLPNNMGYTVSTMYFVDHGKTSLTEVVTNLKMQGAKSTPKKYTLHKDFDMYSWEEGEKSGKKVNFSHAKDLSNMDFEKMPVDVLEEMKVKKGGTETFLGRTCDVLEMNSEVTGKGKLLTWKNIPMFSDMLTMGMKVVAEVTELIENPELEPAIFQLPEGVEFKEITMPKNLKE
ncbi:MAG: hypothetical protein WBC06_15635 [Chitinophagaceae bacterium]